MHVIYIDFWKPIFLIVDMHNYKSKIVLFCSGCLKKN